MKGWRHEPVRHSLAARGIETKSYVQPLTARSEGVFGSANPWDILKQNGNLVTILEYLEKVNNEKEWISDMDLKEDGTIVIVDGQFNGSVIESFMSWDPDDPGHCIGYCHSHPPANFPWFSSTDYLLTMRLHDLRSSENKSRCPWTFMGLVAEGKFQLVAMKPSRKWAKKFEGLEQQYDKDLSGTHERVLTLEKEMADAGELIRFPEISLN